MLQYAAACLRPRPSDGAAWRVVTQPASLLRPAHPAPAPTLSSAPLTPQIVVNGLPWAWTWKELKDLMAGAGGNIVRADVVYGRDGRR